MIDTLIDGPVPGRAAAPGLFRAVCSSALAQPLDTLTADQLEQAEAEHWQQFWDRKAEVKSIYVPCRFETSDRAAYAEHMKAHGARNLGGDNWPWARSIARGWSNSLGLKPEGKPFRPSTKVIAAAVETCPHCGLIAELDNPCNRTRQADLLWWREHLQGCEIAHRAA